MGILFLAIGLIIFFSKKFLNREILDDEPLLRYMVLIIFTLYGGFRIYRGYAKQYYGKDD